MSGGSDLPVKGEGHAFGVPRRREDVITLLSTAYAHGELEEGELERRLERAERAGTIEELDALVSDFPSPARAPLESVPPAREEIERQVAELDGLSAPTRFTLIGDQHVAPVPGDPRVMRSVSIVGDSTVDLRALSGQPGVFLLKVVSVIGDTSVIVPEGTEVQNRLRCLIGDQKTGRRKEGVIGRLMKRLRGEPERPEGSRRPPGPTVVVTGYKLIGDFELIRD